VRSQGRANFCRPDCFCPPTPPPRPEPAPGAPAGLGSPNLLHMKQTYCKYWLFDAKLAAGFCDVSRGFKVHDWKGGLARRIAPDARPVAAVEAPRGKGGRPREIEGRPWEAEGLSRRTWERRRKKG
jgi:hypothetical protein